MDAGDLRARLEAHLWPLLDELAAADDVAGLAVAVVRDEEVVARGFGVRDVGTGEPVTPETMFHLASVSKPFVATAIGSLVHGSFENGPDGAAPALGLDDPIVRWVPEFSLADNRAGEVTVRGLLSHSSGLPDVHEYGWHDPQLGDDALSEFARSLAGRRLLDEPGARFAYSNAGFELLGLLLSRVVGGTFEEAIRQRVLAPLGMSRSTFLRAEVPAHLAASPHVGLPLTVPEGVYPYTRQHAPSSSLHANLVELVRWVQAHVTQPPRLHPALLELLWRPVVPMGNPPWEESAALGWAMGTYRGHRTANHSGADPGFGSRLVLVPEQRTGVVVLANSNTVPTWSIAAAALDLALPGPGGDAVDGLEELRGLVRDRPAASDLDDEGYEKAVWGAIELHRASLVRPLLQRWTAARPESSRAWTMTGWADQVDGEIDAARTALRRALALDPDDGDAASFLAALPPDPALPPRPA